MANRVIKKIRERFSGKKTESSATDKKRPEIGKYMKSGSAQEQLWRPGAAKQASGSASSTSSDSQSGNTGLSAQTSRISVNADGEYALFPSGEQSGRGNRSSKGSRTRVASADDKSGQKKRRRRKPAAGKGLPQAKPEKHLLSRDTIEPASVASTGSVQEQWDISGFEVTPSEGKTRFHDLDIPDTVMHAIADLGFRYCTPIQSEILPHILKGTDASGRAQTGTGKTAAFLICILNRFIKYPVRGNRQAGAPRALILAPTRELALQIEKEAGVLAKYVPTSMVSLIGGINFNAQADRLKGPVDIVVATPGRLLDFCRRRQMHLKDVEILVIDEADRMLDMGFIPDVRSIIRQTPPKAKRQTLLFSATLTPEVTRLASQWTKDPVTVEINPDRVAVESVDQVIYIITAAEKLALLYNLLKSAGGPVIVFGNRRDVTGGLTDRLKQCGINCALLSGAVTQDKRQTTLENFKTGKIDVLIATDVAGRGIHVDNVRFVINYNLPEDPEDYVHRIGRTGRAGASGTSISFACEEDSFAIPAIEKYTGKTLVCTHPDDSLLKLPAEFCDKIPDMSSSRRGKPAGSSYAGRRGMPRRASSQRRRR